MSSDEGFRSDGDVLSSGAHATKGIPPPTGVDNEPVLVREIIAAGLWTVLADWLIFRAEGLAGPALFFSLTPFLFILSRPCRTISIVRIVTPVLLWLVAARMVWQGSALNVLCAIGFVGAVAMSMAGAIPYVVELLLFLMRVAVDGCRRSSRFRIGAIGSGNSELPSTEQVPSASKPTKIHLSNGLALLLPVVAVIIFGGIFVLANPNLLEWVREEARFAFDIVITWFDGMSIWEIPFCIAALVIGAGMMRPYLPLPLIGPADTAIATESTRTAPLYSAFRNTLFTLVLLFAVYLVFEFLTLWKRDFPPGFYYAGYAHQGAAWLTFSLALATGVLSIIFSGELLHDSRLPKLKRLAWIWSGQNLLLALAVFNRLMIYVGYNGMTVLRTVGFFGTTAVVVGFVVVLVKIASARNFWWLIRAQLIALCLVIAAYGVFPTDYVCHRYNVATVIRGRLHPAVMIAVKPMSDEGFLALCDFSEHSDSVIQEGILAMLARRHAQLQSEQSIRGATKDHWTSWQGSRELLRAKLDDNSYRWSHYKDAAKRNEAIEQFKSYAMQWY